MKYPLIPSLTLIAFLAVGAASAVDSAALARAGLIAPETVTTHRETLGLSSEQETRLKQIHEELQAQAAPMEQAVTEQKKALEALIRDENITVAAAGAGLKALLEAEGAVKALQLRLLIELRAALTPEQRAQAMSLAKADALERMPLQSRVTLKANRLRAAFDEIGLKPAESLAAKGAAIEAQLSAGDLEGADRALDALIVETGLDEPVGEAPADFSDQDPGAIDLDSLKSRFEAAEARARAVIRLPVLRQLAQAKDALEAAKAAEDAAQVGRILTWAEGVLQ